ncbi:MAG: hypothetical protein K9N23_03235 [Akkermansiaceae bacterium]|nr:hypothetical protein [Akkermansiaceae bacterium]MCF7730669.1 hypothetical protein [Akkermansiaceae bacterium]
MKRIIEALPVRRPAYFWWLLANLLAASFAVISWVVCLNVFGHLEIPRNYEILGKLGRLPERREFTAEQAPNGNALAPKELYRKFFGMAAKDLERVNGLLLRNYLTNSANSLVLTYLEGDYRVRSVRLLDEGDFLSPGLVVSAEALVKPNEAMAAAPYPVWIEYLFPGAGPEVAGLFKRGDVLVVDKSPNCASVVHVGKMPVDGEETLWLTVIPVVSGPYEVGGGRTFEIGLPETLRPRTGFPVMESQ